MKVSLAHNGVQPTSAIYWYSCVLTLLWSSLSRDNLCDHGFIHFSTRPDIENTGLKSCFDFDLCFLLDISGSLPVGAAPESSAFLPTVNLAALILTARTVLWQTSAGSSCLIRGEPAGHRQQTTRGWQPHLHLLPALFYCISSLRSIMIPVRMTPFLCLSQGFAERNCLFLKLLL